jgi:uncharacterized hydrophobic protein (TIGR00271 family)
MSDSKQKDETLPKENMSLLRGAMRDTWLFTKESFFRLTHLADDTDIEGTISSIRGGIVLKGSNLWVLICSVMIASIGLDLNSPAVIIGAMLISPLMSPILGIGLAVGMNDRSTLALSFRNFALAIVLSMFTAWVYFKITPLGEFTDEMQGRIAPTLLDVFVAFFGGIAGIIAGSRTEKTNAIPGVAIATALMPPLCTASYGLAAGRMDIFGGAFYLFFINAVFISISTYLIVKYLKFPTVKRERPKLTVLILLYTILFFLLLPSFWFLGKKLQENYQTQVLREFVHDNFNTNTTDKTSVEWSYLPYRKGGFLEETPSVKWDFWNLDSQDSIYQLRVVSFGAGTYINNDSLSRLEKELNQEIDKQFNLLRMNGYDSAIISLVQSDKPNGDDVYLKKVNEMQGSLDAMIDNKFQQEFGTYEEKDGELLSREQEIKRLQDEIVQIVGDTIHFQSLKRELRAIFPDMQNLSLSKASTTDFEKDTLSYFAIIKWQGLSKRNSRERAKNEKTLLSFLKVKFNSDAVEVVSK